MRSHTNNFKTEIKQYGRQLSQSLATNITINHLDGTGSSSLYNDEINSIRYYYDCDIFKTCMQTLVIDSKVEIPIGTEIYCRLGIKVNNSNENLLFNDFYVNKVEQQKDKKSWLVTCYDKMIETMKDYESFYVATTDTTFTNDKNYYVYYNGKYLRYLGDRTLNPTTLGLYQSAFPMTIKDYILAICNRLNITTMNISQETGNFLKQVTSEHYVDVDGNSMGYTYRDVLNEIAGALGEFLYIEGSYLTHKSFLTTNDTINEEYFNDKNVTIGKKIGPYNVVVLSRANDSDNIHYPSTLPSNPIEFKISNNLILEQDNRSEFIQGIYNRINNLEFYVNDFATKGIMYYELGDKYNVSIDGNTYPCLMLNDDITITTGLKENIYTKEPQQSVTDYKYSSTTDKVEISSRNAKILVDKANGRIDQIVEAVGEDGEVTTASIVQSINDSGSSIKLNADKVYINGVTFDNNQVMTMTKGEIHIEQIPGGLGLNTWYNDETNNTIVGSEVDPTGFIADERNATTNEVIKQGIYLNDQINITEIATNNIYNLFAQAHGGITLTLYDNNYNELRKLRLDSAGIFLNNGSTQVFSVTTGTGGDTTINGNTTIGGSLFVDGQDVKNYMGKSYSNVDANDFRSPGVYYLTQNCSNVPNNYIYLSVLGKTDNGDFLQVAYDVSTTKVWKRTYTNNRWYSWNEIGGYQNYNVSNYLVNSWSTNGASYMVRSNGIKYLQFAVRYGTSTTVVSSLPSDMRPSTNLIVLASNLANVGYAIIYTTGEIIIYGNIFSSGSSNLVFSAIYQ